MPNLLAAESSPYLRQHAENPVEWWPWGPAALARAVAEDKPVLLSIGYAACHWCHVMAHESFENPAVAAVMNAHFVCVKLDREERPDVDAVYMDAVQAMGVRGGWPLNVFLTSDGRPFYGLTYAAAQPWTNLLQSVDRAWRENRAQLVASAEGFTQALQADELRKYGLPTLLTPQLGDPAALDGAFFSFQQKFDRAQGGMDRAPKFPMPAHYAWLLRYHARTGHALALDHTLLTLREMARGGLYDQVGGGWARYSVDGEWLVPHFEKMLYDNGQLLTAYAEAYQLTGDDELRTAAEEAIEFVRRELLDPVTGGVFASLDADSEGEEGRFYVFTWAELARAFPEPAALQLVAAYYRCTEDGNWEHGYNILHRRGSDTQFAARHHLSAAALAQHVAGWRATLLANRGQFRERPGLDNKLLTGWNGLLLKGLCDAYRAFPAATDLKTAAQPSAAAAFVPNPHTLALALGVGGFLTQQPAPEGMPERATAPLLRRDLQPNAPATPAFLEDYAAGADGLLSLYEVTFDEKWLRAADRLLTYALTHFADPANANGLLFYTDAQAPALIARKKELFDNVIPASNSLLARALRRAGLLLSRPHYTTRAQALLACVQPLVEKEPGYLANWAALYEELLMPQPEVVIVGPEAEIFRRELAAELLPGAVWAGAGGQGAAIAPTADTLPLLAGKEAVAGRTTVYVCFQGACQRPVFSVAEARALLGRAA